jgi:signal transduction histidine kinase
VFFGSAEAKRIYGFDKDSPAFTIEAVEACIPERDRVHQALVDLIDNDKPYSLEFEIFTKGKGERRILISRAELERDGSGKPVKVNGVIQDLTESKLTAEALKNSARLLNEMGAIDHIGGWEHDLISREITWTQEIFKIVELESGPVPGPDGHLNFCLPKDREIFEKEYRHAVETGQPLDLALQCTTAKERLIWVRAIGHPEFKNGQCVKMRGTLQDITERKKNQENIMQSQRLESVGALAGGIAHDFNNILSAILGFTELARDSEPSNLQLQEDLGEIYIAGLRAKELVQQIMAFSRKKGQIFYPLSVPETVKEALGLLRSTFPASIEMNVDIDENVPPVLADPTQLHQIIINICTNARQAMDNEGGFLTIKVSETTLSNELLAELPSLIPGIYVQLYIQDTGTGIDPEILDLIFDPYFTTKNLGDGTGLGLAVTYGIIREMAGESLLSNQYWEKEASLQSFCRWWTNHYWKFRSSGQNLRCQVVLNTSCWWMTRCQF